MPWEEKTVERSRKEFISEVIRGDESISALCRKYEITRKTGYKWIERFKEDNILEDRSHAPFHVPNRTPKNVETLVLELRDEHPAWGARKLKRRLEDTGHKNIPAASTICDILKRNDRVDIAESIKHIPYERFVYDHPNDLWQMDYKGHFGMLDGNRCNPLTITDDHSRFNLCLDAKKDQRTPGTKSSIERVFAEYGLPDAFLCDNGAPWGDSNGGFTPLEVWMMQLGILPIHGRPRHPQTQGKEERFHKTIVDEMLRFVVIKDLEHAQHVFDPWRYEYNYERPHSALNLDTPSKHYRESKRKYIPGNAKEPEYDVGARLRKVNCKGYLSIQRYRYYFSETFIGKILELKDIDEGITDICYGRFRIAQIDTKEQKMITRKIVRC
jgi:transposase InsO family protein